MSKEQWDWQNKKNIKKTFLHLHLSFWVSPSRNTQLDFGIKYAVEAGKFHFATLKASLPTLNVLPIRLDIKFFYRPLVPQIQQCTLSQFIFRTERDNYFCTKNLGPRNWKNKKYGMLQKIHISSIAYILTYTL